jgi:hypothetical protein
MSGKGNVGVNVFEKEHGLTHDLEATLLIQLQGGREVRVHPGSLTSAPHTLNFPDTTCGRIAGFTIMFLAELGNPLKKGKGWVASIMNRA